MFLKLRLLDGCRKGDRCRVGLLDTGHMLCNELVKCGRYQHYATQPTW